MKRALAERAKQQKEQAAASGVGTHPPSIGQPFLHQQMQPQQMDQVRIDSEHIAHMEQRHHQQHLIWQQQQQQQRQQSQSQSQPQSQPQQSMEMKVEAIQPPRKIPRIKSSSSASPRTPTTQKSNTKLSSASTTATPSSVPSSSSSASIVKSKSSKKNKINGRRKINSSGNDRTGSAGVAGSGSGTTSGSGSKSGSGNISKTPTNPKKRSRPSSSSNNNSSNNHTHSNTTTNTKNQSHIKILPSPITLPTIEDYEEDDEENETTNTKFYLKHQNRALASELYNYKHAITILERERNFRREECHLIHGVLRGIVSNWNAMEGVLIESMRNGNGDNSVDSSGSSAYVNGSNKKLITKKLSSTGKGNDVENVYSIMESIIQLSNSSTAFQTDDEIISCKQEQVRDKDGNSNSNSNRDKDEIMLPIKQEDGKGSNRQRREKQKQQFKQYQQQLLQQYQQQQRHNDLLDSDSNIEQTFLKHLSEASTSFSKRITNFQRLQMSLIQHYLRQKKKNSSNSNNNANANNTSIKLEQQNKKYMTELLEFGELKKQIAILQNNCQDLEGKLGDLAKDRDVAKESERRVRRGLYRVSTGRMKITEVLKAVEESSALGVEDLEELQKDLLSASLSKSPSNTTSSADPTKCAHGTSSDTNNVESTAITIDGKILGIDDVMDMKKRIDDLLLVNESRDKKLDELMVGKHDREKEINSLLAKATTTSIKDDDVQNSTLFIEVSSKLKVMERENKELKDELQSMKLRWAVTKGDLKLSRKTIDDLEEKHKRRLKELSGESTEDSNEMEMRQEMEHAKKVVQLEHKLKHALDSVRQAEAMKTSLSDAASMKDILQGQIDDLKAKNQGLESLREVNSGALLESSDTSPNKMSEKLSRLKRELERSEKGRDSLMAINRRLQQQSCEKDEMNAKSLSTILHLKQLSEQLEQEKGILEKKHKSAEQLAVMARLAANAKEKVEREAMREKEMAEAEGKKFKSNMETLMKQNDDVQGELSLTKSQIQKARSDLETLKERCDSLVGASMTSEKRIKKLTEELLVSKKDAVEAIQKAGAVKASSSGPEEKEFNSEFTAKQLTIQVNQLKSRIACPVCNTRDKNVIISRCRHMFCRHCVMLNLENRNRKCPSCGLRFDKKDVEDVWF